MSQIRTLAVARIGKRICRISPEELDQVCWDTADFKYIQSKKSAVFKKIEKIRRKDE
jgi:hypothetical protein